MVAQKVNIWHSLLNVGPWGQWHPKPLPPPPSALLTNSSGAPYAACQMLICRPSFRTCCVLNTEETEAQKIQLAISVSIPISLGQYISHTHINRVTKLHGWEDLEILCPFPRFPNEKNMLRTQHVPHRKSQNWKLRFSRCLICPVSAGLIINGTASQNVSHSLGYKFSSL